MDRSNKSFELFLGNFIKIPELVSISHLPDLKENKFLICDNLNFESSISFKRMKNEFLSNSPKIFGNSLFCSFVSINFPLDPRK